MTLKDKMKTYNFWISLVSAILLTLKVVGDKYGFIVDSNLVMDITTAICSVFVILGIISAPQKASSKALGENNYMDNNIFQTENDTENDSEYIYNNAFKELQSQNQSCTLINSDDKIVNVVDEVNSNDYAGETAINDEQQDEYTSDEPLSENDQDVVFVACDEQTYDLVNDNNDDESQVCNDEQVIEVECVDEKQTEPLGFEDGEAVEKAAQEIQPQIDHEGDYSHEAESLSVAHEVVDEINDEEINNSSETIIQEESSCVGGESGVENLIKSAANLSLEDKMKLLSVLNLKS